METCAVCQKDLSTEREKKQSRILRSPPSKIVLTALFTMLQEVCSSYPELSSVSKSYICRNCFRQILKYHSLKQKIISDLRTSFQVRKLQQSLQLPDPPQLHTASSTSSPALTVSKSDTIRPGRLSFVTY